MENEREIEILIEEKSKELERLEVPDDLWFSIEREIERIPKKRKRLFSFFPELLKANRLRIGYGFAFILLLFAALYMFISKKENVETRNIIAAVTPAKETEPVTLKTGTVKLQEVKTKTLSAPITKEKRISALEKKAARKIESIDAYTKSVYQNKIDELDESISECKKIFASDYNQMIKKNLAMVYDEKIKLLLNILKLD